MYTYQYWITDMLEYSIVSSNLACFLSSSNTDDKCSRHLYFSFSYETNRANPISRSLSIGTPRQYFTEGRVVTIGPEYPRLIFVKRSTAGAPRATTSVILPNSAHLPLSGLPSFASWISNYTQSYFPYSTVL